MKMMEMALGMGIGTDSCEKRKRKRITNREVRDELEIVVRTRVIDEKKKRNLKKFKRKKYVCVKDVVRTEKNERWWTSNGWSRVGGVRSG